MIGSSRDEILAAIRRTALANGGRPLGRLRLAQATGITEADWGRFWPRLGDAQREAGFEANTLNPASERDVVIEHLISLIRERGKFPTVAEMRLQRHHDPTFPSKGVYARYGSRVALVEMVLSYCGDQPEYSDVVEILGPIGAAAEASAPASDEGAPGRDVMYGFVYLLRGRRGEYKIGRTSVVGQRIDQLATGSAVPLTLVHEIRTDDPVGVEAYWHRRFAGRRIRGEWFKLTPAEVSAFKRWKRIA
jgi:hypothetical protein